MSKPIEGSVTAEPCACGYLERAADDPESPIIFDQEMNEYQFEYPSPCGSGDCPSAKGHLVIYHCPFCGGVAPESRRTALFTTFDREEMGRVTRLFDGMRTLQEVVAALGPPEEDKEGGLMEHRPEADGQAPTMRSFRTLRYTRLSDTADVEVFADPAEGKVRVVLMGKYIGPPIENAASNDGEAQ